MILRSHRHLIVFFVLALCAFLASCQTASACECGPTPTVLESFDRSDVVIIAREAEPIPGDEVLAGGVC